MAVPTTWTELKAEMADWLDRTDLTTQIPSFIGYAEARLNRRLRVPEMEADATASVSTDDIALPTDLLSLRSVYIDDDPRVVLSQVSPARLRELYPTDTTTGIPRVFAIQESTDLLLGPYPDAAYTVVINYWAKIPALGAGTATNWLLTAHPDLYLAAAMTEGCLLTMDEQRAALWDSRTEAKIAELNEAGRRKMRSQAPTMLRSDMPLIRRGFDIATGL